MSCWYESLGGRSSGQARDGTLIKWSGGCPLGLVDAHADRGPLLEATIAECISGPKIVSNTNRARRELRRPPGPAGCLPAHWPVARRAPGQFLRPARPDVPLPQAVSAPAWPGTPYARGAGIGQNAAPCPPREAHGHAGTCMRHARPLMPNASSCKQTIRSRSDPRLMLADGQSGSSGRRSGPVPDERVPAITACEPTRAAADRPREPGGSAPRPQPDYLASAPSSSAPRRAPRLRPRPRRPRRCRSPPRRRGTG